MSYLFDDYENLVNTLSGPDGTPLGVGMSGQPQHGQQQQRSQPSQQQQQQQQQTAQQQQSMNINIASNTSNNNNTSSNNGSSLLSSSRFGSFSSNLGSEANPTDFNEALSSSLNSGIMSPYSTGSSPDDFFLSATTSNADSQASGDEFEFPMDAHGQNHPFGNSGSHNDVLYPQNLAPVPMGESMSNSTVTFNTGEQNLQQQQQQQQQFNFQPMKTVDEEDESPESRKSDYSDAKATANSNGSGSTTMGPGGRRVKSSHNLIEKKYRTNINSKIIELRNCVPALRILVAKNGNHRTSSTPNEPEVEDDYYEGNGYTDDEEKCDGLKPAKKLNKATILAKASEYIKHLEKKNDTLRSENEQLRSLLNQRASSNSQGQHFGQNYSQSMHSSPYNNSSSTNGNLVSPLNAEQQGQQNQQFPYDHQTLNNKLMMGPASGFLNVNGLDEFSNSYSPSDRKFV